MPDLSGLYPQPPQQNQGLLTGNPMQTIGALGELQRIGITAQQAPALSQIPGQQLTNLQLANQNQQLQLQDSARQVFLNAVVNGLPQKTDPKTGQPIPPTSDDVLNTVTNVSRFYPQAMAMGAGGATIDQLTSPGPNGAVDVPGNVRAAQASILGPQGAAARVAGPPTAGGQPTQQSLAQAMQAQGPTPVGLPPGFAERAAGGATIDTQLAGNLANAAEGSPARIGILGNLDNTVDKFTSGPGADWTKVAKSFVNRNVPLPQGWQFDPSSIGAQEEFNKQAMQLAQSQFQTIGGTGTDSKFASAFETSPNDALSNLGNKGIIRLLKGNEDAIQAKNTAWLDQTNANPNASYRQFSQQFNSHFDPRVFQFKYLTPAERTSYVQSMDPQDQQRFLVNATIARKNGWTNYDMSQ